MNSIHRLPGSTPTQTDSAPADATASAAKNLGSLPTDSGERPVTRLPGQSAHSFATRPEDGAPSHAQPLREARGLDPAQVEQDLATVRDASDFFQRLMEDPRSASEWLAQKLTK